MATKCVNEIRNKLKGKRKFIPFLPLGIFLNKQINDICMLDRCMPSRVTVEWLRNLSMKFEKLRVHHNNQWVGYVEK